MRTLVITGATAGVGRATARLFAENGFDVALIARGRNALSVAAAEVESLGGHALELPVDVADPPALREAGAHAEESLGPIDVWVNNAMTSVFAPFTEIQPEEFRRTVEVTFMGVVNGTRAALDRMVPRDRGTIVQVGSALAHRGIPLQSAYCGSKHAIRGFTESVRCELLHQHSRVQMTMVQMPALNTPQFNWVKSKLSNKPQPVPPVYQPEVAARSILWASRHPRREVWVGGSTIGTILGNRLVPGLLDRYLARTGYDSQQTDEEAAGDRPSNLFEPVDRDFGAHGDFDEVAREATLTEPLTEFRPLLTGVAATAAAGLLIALLKR